MDLKLIVARLLIQIQGEPVLPELDLVKLIEDFTEGRLILKKEGGGWFIVPRLNLPNGQ